MRFEGILRTWNDDRGFGRIESTQGGEPIFVHVSAWPNGSGRPRLNQAVSFEIEVGPKGKRAKNVRSIQAHRTPTPSAKPSQAQWGTATLFVIPAFMLVYAAIAVLWKLPWWVAAMYLATSIATYITYASDKSAAHRGSRRTPENTLHLLSMAGGWPGALLAQQRLRHKTTKQAFRQVFWATVVLNVAALVALASPFGRQVLGALGPTGFGGG